MNDKRTLESLRNKYKGHIYLRLSSKEEYDDCIRRAETEGFRFGQRLPTECIGEWQDMLALCENKQLSFCNTFSRMAYASGASNVRRISYAKYISGGGDYLI